MPAFLPKFLRHPNPYLTLLKTLLAGYGTLPENQPSLENAPPPQANIQALIPALQTAGFTVGPTYISLEYLLETGLPAITSVQAYPNTPPPIP